LINPEIQKEGLSMDDHKKTKAQLLEEIGDLRRKVQQLTKKQKSDPVGEEQYRPILNNIEDGYYEVDLAGKYIYLNSGFCKYHGRSLEDMIGRSYRDFSPTPESAQAIYDIFNTIYRTGIPAEDISYQIIRKDGNIRDLEMSASLIKDSEGNYIGFRGISRDITDRKKMEIERERYQDFFENATDGCFELDLRGAITFANEAACRMFGYTREEFKGMDYHNYTTPENAKNLFTIFNEVYRTGLPSKVFEYEIKHKGQEIRTLETTASLIRDAEGNPTGFRGITRDITERKKLETEQERSQAFVENISDGVWEVDLAGSITYANEAICHMFGYPREEFMGINYRAFTTPEIAESLFKIFNETYRTGTPAVIFDYEVIRKNGERFFLETSASLIRDQAGNPTGFRGVSRDITERKKMEAENERYRDFVENITDGCFEVDLAGNMTFFNDSACRMFGYPREVFMGMNNRAYTSPETAKKTFKIFNEIYRTGLPAKIFDYEVIHKDGSTGILEMSASLIRDRVGNPVGFRGISRDISDRKKMEAETVRLSEQLNQARRLEAIGTLAGGVAHDFNNLLMGIQGYASLMLLDIDTHHPFYEKLKAIETQVKSAAGLTGQLLGFARGGRYEVKSTDINQLISKTASLFGRTKKGIQIHETLAEDLWEIEADQGQMEQVLLNLFVNAGQAMPGGGNLYLQTENVHLDESYAEPHGIPAGPYVKISVTDTGVGMDPETKARIFEPFFTTKEMGRGTGLGLATAYGIITGHGGIITVYSEKGYGTTFNLYLPASPKTIFPTNQKAPEILTREETLLLVDDEKMITEVTGTMLTRLGYQLLIAHSGEEAVEIYRDNASRIHLVIMDLVMPGIGGGEAIDQIKSINPQAKIILSSGFSLNGEAREVMNRGARAFIQKPFLMDDLSKIIKEVLEAP
jgi:two-component system, cell cycle sensor histidine kinase and response regulator CckA